MISPYEVKDRQHNQSYNDHFELKIDKGLTYSSGTDSCSVSFVFSEVSADKMKTLTDQQSRKKYLQFIFHYYII